MENMNSNINLKLICFRVKNITLCLLSNYIVILILIFIILISLLTLIVSKNETSTTKECDSQYYIAAVVEYHPRMGPNPLQSIQNNLPVYEDIIHNASHYDVDILVFPEAGLTGVSLPSDRKEIRSFLTEIPSPESNTTPCFNQYCGTVLKKLSCTARLHHMYVVVNLPEIEYCKTEDDVSCPEDLAYYYNTNVVFDREGRIIARYRKYNLFGEFGFDHTHKSELCTFDTDFGVKFGMFICFDILFQDPAARLIRETGVKDIIFSTAWFSEIPLLPADSVQAGWAYTSDVNLIAAGYDAPAMGGGGSGIYAGRDGPLVMFMPDRPGTQMLVSRVLKRQFYSCENQSKKCSIDSNCPTFKSDYLVLPHGKENTSAPNNNWPRNLRFLLDNSFKEFAVSVMQSTDVKANQDDTHTTSFAYKRDGFECVVTVSWQNKDNNVTTGYNMFAYSGTRTFGGFREAHVETCGLTAYKPSATTAANAVVAYDPPKDLVTITAITIVARTPDLGTLTIPTTLDTLGYPLSNDYYAFSKRTVMVDKRKTIEINMQLSKPVINLFTFGIYKLPQ